MEYVNLDKLVWFQEGPGVRNYQYVDKGIKLINVTNLVNGKLKLHLTNRFISEEEANGKYKHFMCDIGDLVIASSGITYDTLDKKIAFVTEKDLPLCMNTSVIRFKPLDNNVCLDFIYYFFKSKKYKNQISKLMTGSAQLNYGPSHLHKVKIPLYNFDKQLKIATELKKIDSIILICHNNLENLDNIVKSRFIEMFGRINDSIYDISEIVDLCEFVKDGTHQTPTYTDDTINGYKFLSSKDVTSGKIDWSNIKFIPEELHEKLYKTIKPQRNDILLAKNGTTGTAALVETDDVFDIYVSLAILRFKQGNNPKYMLYAINNDDTKEQFNGSLKGVGVPNLHLGEIKKTKLIVPPIELQNKFVEFVEQIDKSKYSGGVGYAIC